MSRKYKFYDKEGLYFVSFATVYWIDVFVRDQYFSEIAKSLDFCRKQKEMEIYAWCILPSHVHLIIRSKEGKPDILLGEMKRYTSNKLQQLLSQHNRKQKRIDLMDDGKGSQRFEQY